MSQDKRTAKDDAIYLRRFKALELRVVKEMTMREVAKECGVSIATAWKDVQWMVEHDTADRGDYVKTYREVESERLDEWQAKLNASLLAAADVDDLKKIYDVLLKISERRAKLLGLDTVVKQEIEATINGEVTPATVRALMKQHFGEVEPPADDDDVQQPE